MVHNQHTPVLFTLCTRIHQTKKRFIVQLIVFDKTFYRVALIMHKQSRLKMSSSACSAGYGEEDERQNVCKVSGTKKKLI